MVKKELANDDIHSTTLSTSKKKYKGVRMRSWGSWVSEIRAPNQKTRIWLGSYSTAEAAARAYDAALLCLKGSSANLNFPISSSSFAHFHNFLSSNHDDNNVMSPKSIQRVAAEAAANTAFFDGNVDNNTTGSNDVLPSSPLPSSSSSSSSSSVSSTSNNDSFMMMEPSWFNFDDILSPKYVGQMMDGTLFDPPIIDDFYEESDIRLWSFC
ncbi:unnamed protein product [Citrullus colocynthis]|uniref:AP2/ERF domain-containing protein n=1 Tax=Citrullus colocynthis TaxID=252529 RepID=A0ABP0Y1L6_9ROSI